MVNANFPDVLPALNKNQQAMKGTNEKPIIESKNMKFGNGNLDNKRGTPPFENLTM